MPPRQKREHEIIAHVTCMRHSLYTSSFGFIQDIHRKYANLFLVDQKKKIGPSLSFSTFSRRINPRMRGRIEYTLNCNLEIAPMIRILGLTVALVVPLCLTTTTHAQMTPYNGGGAQGPYYGVSVYGGQPYGGFGLEYSQAFPAGGMIMDQYGLWHAVPGVQSAPAVAATQPQPRSRSRTVTSFPPGRDKGSTAALSAPDRFFGRLRRRWWYAVFTGDELPELWQRLRFPRRRY